MASKITKIKLNGVQRCQNNYLKTEKVATKINMEIILAENRINEILGAPILEMWPLFIDKIVEEKKGYL